MTKYGSTSDSIGSRALRGAALAALAALAAAPAAADWLVTRDGARIETRGPWRVDGRRILFDLPNGTLSALRADEVDLDRSAQATAEARVVAEKRVAEEPKKEPVVRLTEKDIPPSGEAADEAAEAPAGSGESTPTALEVVSWEKTEVGEGEAVEIFGTLRNNSTDMITSPTLMVAIYDSDGGLLATNNGVVNAPQIAAGKTANFRVTFAGLSDFAAARFDAQGRGFKQRTDLNPGQQGEEEEQFEEEPPADEGEVETSIEPPQV
jgi:hypothetical protein